MKIIYDDEPVTATFSFSAETAAISVKRIGDPPEVRTAENDELCKNWEMSLRAGAGTVKIRMDRNEISRVLSLAMQFVEGIAEPGLTWKRRP